MHRARFVVLAGVLAYATRPAIAHPRDCALFRVPTLEGIIGQTTRCLAEPVPPDARYEIEARTGQQFEVSVGGQRAIVTTGPASCNGKPAVLVETTAAHDFDHILNIAERCAAATSSSLDLDQPIVYVQLAHWVRTTAKRSRLVEGRRVWVAYGKAGIELAIDLATETCTVAKLP